MRMGIVAGNTNHSNNMVFVDVETDIAEVRSYEKRL